MKGAKRKQTSETAEAATEAAAEAAEARTGARRLPEAGVFRRRRESAEPSGDGAAAAVPEPTSRRYKWVLAGTRGCW